MLKKEKEETVASLKEELKTAKSFVLTNYRGLNVHQLSEMRKRLRSAGIDYKVIKNTLFRRAASESGLDALLEYLVGPTAAAFAREDLVAPAKLLSDFTKEFEVLKIKGGVLNGEVIGADKITMLASLPSIEVLYSKMLGSLKSPMHGLVNVMAGQARQLVTVLNQISTQKTQTE